MVRGAGRRVRLLLVVAVAALVVDQSGKLVAAAVHPAGYVQNPTLRGSVWPSFALALGVLLLPYRPLVAAVGLSLGGASGNLLDHYLWPGGTPDFISALLATSGCGLEPGRSADRSRQLWDRAGSTRLARSRRCSPVASDRRYPRKSSAGGDRLAV